jgi:hypothetical protein
MMIRVTTQLNKNDYEVWYAAVGRAGELELWDLSGNWFKTIAAGKWREVERLTG